MASPVHKTGVFALVALFCIWSIWYLDPSFRFGGDPHIYKAVVGSELGASSEQFMPVATANARPTEWPTAAKTPTLPSHSASKAKAEEPSLYASEPEVSANDAHSHFAASSPAAEPSRSPLKPTVAVVHDSSKIPQPVSERPLILYAYSESEYARENLKFFLAHGLHTNADFVFILNGPTTAVELIPKEPNIRYVQRPNDCYDLGAYAEVLQTDELYKGYKKFIMLNASIRGPFLPYWAEGCWSDMYLKRVTDKVKLVGMTGNCFPHFHVQSMIWATDITGLEVLLFPPTSSSPHPQADKWFSPKGINDCFHTWASAVHAEISASTHIKNAGYKLDVMMSAYHSSETYEEECDTSDSADVLFQGKYFGTNVHPYETIFLKSNRDIDPVTLQRMSDWTDQRGYSSYEFCKA